MNLRHAVLCRPAACARAYVRAFCAKAVDVCRTRLQGRLTSFFASFPFPTCFSFSSLLFFSPRGRVRAASCLVDISRSAAGAASIPLRLATCDPQQAKRNGEGRRKKKRGKSDRGAPRSAGVEVPPGVAGEDGPKGKEFGEEEGEKDGEWGREFASQNSPLLKMAARSKSWGGDTNWKRLTFKVSSCAA